MVEKDKKPSTKSNLKRSNEKTGCGSIMAPIPEIERGRTAPANWLGAARGGKTSVEAKLRSELVDK